MRLLWGNCYRIYAKNVLGLSQEQYANLVGISRRTLTDIEQDKGKLTQSVLDKVFKPLGLKAGLVPYA